MLIFGNRPKNRLAQVLHAPKAQIRLSVTHSLVHVPAPRAGEFRRLPGIFGRIFGLRPVLSLVHIFSEREWAPGPD